jgi:hypothetical protein
MLLTLVAGLAAAVPAAASPITVFFDGPSGQGLSQSTFDEIKDDFLVVSPALSTVTTRVTRGYQFGSLDPMPPTGDHSTYSEIWTILKKPALEYLLFVTTEDYWGGDRLVSYTDSSVGLSINLANDPNWAIVRSTDGAQDYYYLAYPFGPGPRTSFAVNLVVNAPIILAGGDYSFPKLGIALAVPEPSTAALFASGLLALLATTRRHRS